MAVWDRIGRCILMPLFTDTVTVYSKISEAEWRRTVVEGVQWTDKVEKKNVDGVLSVIKYASVTFPEGTYEELELKIGDCIVLGIVSDEINEVRGTRVGDLRKKYPDSGIIQAIRNNTRRTFLKNTKVVLE